MVHQGLVSDFSEDFGKLGYKGKNGSYTTDENSSLKSVLEWDLVNTRLLNDSASSIRTINQDDEIAKIAIFNNDARKAVDWLTKECIKKHEYDNEELMNDKMMRAGVGGHYTWRAWCEWHRAKTDKQMSNIKRVETLGQVVDDCGFMTGKIFF
jgi:hypothetical protein